MTSTDLASSASSAAKPLSSAPPLPHRMLFGERAFGFFFVLWGLFLQLDHFSLLSFLTSHSSLFIELEWYAPGWLWGSSMLGIGVGRYLAYRYHSPWWRLALSSATIILLGMIAGAALLAGMIAATFPLAAFVTTLAMGFHRMLAQDIELGL